MIGPGWSPEHIFKTLQIAMRLLRSLTMLAIDVVGVAQTAYQILGVMAVLITVVSGAALGARWVKTHLGTPVILVHYWWETVIDAEQQWLSPAITIGATYPVAAEQAQRYLHRARGLYRLMQYRADINGPMDVDKIPWTWLLHPTYRMGIAGIGASGVKVLRFVVFNSSKREIVTREDFGTLLVELEVGETWVLGWRAGRLGQRAAGESLDFDAVAIEETGWYQRYDAQQAARTEWLRMSDRSAALAVELPHDLSPTERLADDLTVLYTRTNSRDPHVTLKTSSSRRVRSKPWEPATTRPFWMLPGRVSRWIAQSEVVQRWAPR